MLFQKWRNQLFLSSCSLIIKSLEWYSTLPGALYKCLLETKRIELYIENSAYLVRNYSGLVTTLSPRCNFTFQAQCILQKLAIQRTRYKWNQGNIWKWQLSGSEKVGEPWLGSDKLIGSRPPVWILYLFLSHLDPVSMSTHVRSCRSSWRELDSCGPSPKGSVLVQCPRSPGTLAISLRAVKCSHREFTSASTETNTLVRERKGCENTVEHGKNCRHGKPSSHAKTNFYDSP